MTSCRRPERPERDCRKVSGAQRVVSGPARPRKNVSLQFSSPDVADALGRAADIAAVRWPVGRATLIWAARLACEDPKADVMREYLKFFIDGEWVEPAQVKTLDVENPATELVVGRIALGSAADVDRAVKAAKAAFAAWSRTSREERLEVLNRIVTEYEKRFGDLMTAVTQEMGAPASLCQDAQVPAGLDHLIDATRILQDFPFQEIRGQTMIVREPIGVCGFITPWNWPLNQITHKVAPALATGCTMVLKPSEVAPFSGQIFAEVLDAARVPPGVFNLVHGDGPGVGVALACHQDIDMVSFTGSTRAGIEVARNAAATVKRVHQELGGKSPNIILNDDDQI